VSAPSGVPAGRRGVLSWALYDWANSAFATTVMAGFFPVFFKQFWSDGAAVTDSTFRLGLTNSIASLIIVASAPLLGAIADQGGVRKRFLIAFAAIGIGMTAALFFVGQGQWQLAAVCFAIAVVGFSGSVIFYDSLIVAVAPPGRYERISAFGFALGYLGGGLLFAVNVVMTLYPQWFGLADGADAVRWSFLTVAAWWALFSIPLVLFVQEQPALGRASGTRMIGAGYRQLADTFRHLGSLRPVVLFLLAYWCYIDAVDTIVRMAVDFGLAIGLPANSLIVALLITQFVGFPAAIVFGRIGERWGPKRGIFAAIGVYVMVVLAATRMTTVAEFYALAVVIGLVQGGIQALSRSYFAALIPSGRSAEFFGFYNMLGKFAAVLGPVLVGWIGVVSGNPRTGLLALLALFAAGAVLLWRADLARHEEER
jgi:UMF1 family MFS transporter